MEEKYVTARAAAETLGISTATLYAYVSRGLIRSAEVGDRRHRRGYVAEDVRRLKDRQEARHDPLQAAPHVIHWGMPILDSGLTHIAEGTLFYRGQEVTALAQTRALEEVAALLWLSDLAAGATVAEATAPVAHYREAVARLAPPPGPLPIEDGAGENLQAAQADFVARRPAGAVSTARVPVDGHAPLVSTTRVPLQNSP